MLVPCRLQRKQREEGSWAVRAQADCTVLAALVIPALQLSTMGVPILQGTLKFSEVLGDWPKISQLLSNS